MTTPQKMVHDFQTKYGCQLDLTQNDKLNCRAIASELRSMNQWHIENDNLKAHFAVVVEELAETFEAIADGDQAGILKESSDLRYTVLGLQHALGLCQVSEEGFRRVHVSNMTKLTSQKSPTGKVMKGPDYIPPDLSDLVS